MSKIKKVPEIRFKGYTDAWEQQKLGDITTFKKGKGYSKKDLVENGTPIILYGRLYTDYQTLITKVDTFVVEVENSVISEGGEVIVPASGESAEDISRASVVAESGIILGGDLNIINKCSLLNPVFLALTISNGNQKKEMSKRAQGKSVVHLHNSDLKEISLVFPEIKEQALIGECFEKIDNLITLHQLKYNQVVNYKKAMLEKMFPKNDSRIPEIRFKGCTGAWEPRKFGDIGTVAMCKRVFKEETSENGDVPFYKIGTFGGEADAYITREMFEKYKNMYPYPQKGDILISASGSIGRTVEYTGKDEYFQDSNIVWLQHNKNIDNSFLKVLYNVVQWSCEGSTIKRLYNDNFLKTEIVIPDIKEQSQIGEYFENLDNLIALHQRKIQQLKNIKKALLEKMFV